FSFIVLARRHPPGRRVVGDRRIHRVVLATYDRRNKGMRGGVWELGNVASVLVGLSAVEALFVEEQAKGDIAPFDGVSAKNAVGRGKVRMFGPVTLQGKQRIVVERHDPG